MNKNEETKRMELLAIIGEESDETLETLKTKIAVAIETGTENFKGMMPPSSYKKYVQDIVSYLTNEEEAQEERKEVYDAVMEGCLIGRFA